MMISFFLILYREKKINGEKVILNIAFKRKLYYTNLKDENLQHDYYKNLLSMLECEYFLLQSEISSQKLISLH